MLSISNLKKNTLETTWNTHKPQYSHTHINTHQHLRGLSNWQTTLVGCLCVCCSLCQSMIIRKLETPCNCPLFAHLPSVQRKQDAHVSADIWMTSSDIDFSAHTPAILSLCGQKMYSLRFCLARFFESLINVPPLGQPEVRRYLYLQTNHF